MRRNTGDRERNRELRKEARAGAGISALNSRVEMAKEVDTKHYPLNAGSRSLARDPAEIFEATERRSCAGCAHIIHVELAGDTRAACARNQRYGKRCRFYVERKPERR